MSSCEKGYFINVSYCYFKEEWRELPDSMSKTNGHLPFFKVTTTNVMHCPLTMRL